MKYMFPEGLYSDVRIEHVFETNIRYRLGLMEECKERKYSAAFVRVYDGLRWYYASTTDLGGIQEQIDSLAKLAKPDPNVLDSAVCRKLIPHKDTVMAYVGREVSSVPLDEKLSLLKPAMPMLDGNELVKLWTIRYIDGYTVKEFYSSKGAELMFDWQRSGISIGIQMADGEKKMPTSYSKSGCAFPDLGGYEAGLQKELDACAEFIHNSIPVEPGKYTVIFSPEATGAFTHECFGHKSESDFMIGDETARKEWALGKHIGFEELSIIDTGNIIGNGFTPYDDEGNKAAMTYLIKDGILTGRLHNAESAADLAEEPTGNGRAMNFEYEPIVRQTNTYIGKGSKTLDELIAETENGILVKTISHGSGMSTFTIAPRLSYYIKGGRVDKPVRVAVVSGNVFEALGDIDGISSMVEMKSFVTGGCGKMEQDCLPVGFGGPYIRVKNMNVQ